MRVIRSLLASMAFVAASPVFAATSEPAITPSLTATLITAEEGIRPGQESLTAGLHLELEPGWHTYWRYPGDVGLAPEFDWSGGQNIQSVDILWPAPKRFSDLGMESYGYEGEVVFPLQITLETPGRASKLSVDAEILACFELCVPLSVSVSLDLPREAGLDPVSADLLSRFIAQVPQPAESLGVSIEGRIDDGLLELKVRSASPFSAPDIFFEDAEYISFPQEDILLTDGGFVATLPVDAMPGLSLDRLDITISDPSHPPVIGKASQPAAAPIETPVGVGERDPLFYLGMLVTAFLGGLILNVMPCVLPVLSIKIAGVLARSENSNSVVRKSFLASSAGILSFTLILGAILAALRLAGGQVGWGMQFQNPVFLIVLIGILYGFSLNMLGVFEFRLPQALQRKADKASRGEGYAGDFMTGAFAAVLATPCSAPFLGTAVAFALTGSILDIMTIFGALGLGLAAPYLGIALFPSIMKRLPRPGPWMVHVRSILALMLLATMIWLSYVLGVSMGATAQMTVLGFAGGGIAGLALRNPDLRSRFTGAALVMIVLSALFLRPEPLSAPSESDLWQVYDPARLEAARASGQPVLIDVTAEWCLTCKINKAAVLDDAEIIAAMSEAGVVGLRADWTSRDSEIAEFLAGYDRFGIPFNIVYGRGAPRGIILPEILTKQAVLRAISEASKTEPIRN